MASVKWERRNPSEWRGDTGGYGTLLIQRARQGKRWTFYLMDNPFWGSPAVLSSHDSLQAAKDAGSSFAERLRKP